MPIQEHRPPSSKNDDLRLYSIIYSYSQPMSQYISSFLIEPVVRQARRFSRPANDTPRPARPSLDNNESASRHEELATAATAAHEALPNLDLNTDDRNYTISGAEETLSPTSLEDPEDGQVQAWQDGDSDTTPLPTVEPNTLGPAVDAREHILAAADHPSSTSLNGTPGAARSTTSSFSNSARSMIDNIMSSADAQGYVSGNGSHDPRGRGASQGSQPGDGALPADDGMRQMRRRIIAIQRTNSSSEEKARLVHDVMVEKHNMSQQSLHGLHRGRAHSPGSMHSSTRPFSSSSLKSMDSLRQTTSPPTSSSSAADQSNRFNLTPDDLKPTYYEKPLPGLKDGDNERSSMEIDDGAKALGCAHYKRNIKLQCSACFRWYTCRFCHDAVEDHMLNRRETKNMLCMLCGCAQPASEECTLCSVRGAWYYCNVCKLWDDDPQKSIYHCNDCGICRVGQGLGKDFFHCKTCCVCMSISIRDTHRCIERSTDCDCPICGEYMFTSPQTVVFMRCGHSIHHRCYYEHMKTSYRCPICSRSIVNMEWQFRHLERAIETQPMPPEFQDTKALIYCNDCSAKTSVKYHWLGLKCAVCDSYNTAQLQLLSGPTTISPLQPPADTAAADILPGDGRGRSRQSTSHSRRPTTSAPPLSAIQRMLERSAWPEARNRTAHSVSPNVMTLSPTTVSASDGDDSMDTDGDESDVEFWGGESPRAHQRSPPLEHDMAIYESGDEEDEEDSEDEDMSDEAEEDEADEYNRMEIFGHR